MKINLNEEFYLRIIPMNFVLCRTKQTKDKKTGEEKDFEFVIGYYPNLKAAFTGLAKHKPMDDMPESFQELERAVRDTHGILERVVALTPDDLLEMVECTQKKE